MHLVSNSKKITYFCLVFSVLLTFGCGSIPKKALLLDEQSLEWRKMQSRKYETNDEKKILVACAGLLQDLGFTIEESETKLGIVVGSKDRSAVEAGQVFGKVLFAFFGGNMPIDVNQKLRASIVTRPYGEEKTNIIVRVTFQRIVWNENGQISKLERLNDPNQYQDFFDKLSKSIFLEAQEI